MVEVAVVVVGGTAVASAMGMNGKNDRRETMAYNAYCTYDVKDGRWTMGDGGWRIVRSRGDGKRTRGKILYNLIDESLVLISRLKK